MILRIYDVLMARVNHIDYLNTPADRRIAFAKREGSEPTVVFLGGFMSDMTGTKAQYLDHWAEQRGQAFLRFDYSGHGASSERPEEGCIGDWTSDALSVISAKTKGPLILVGSSMGGWIALLVARRMPTRIEGIVTIAGAPDFTEEMWEGLTPSQRAEVHAAGVTWIANPAGLPYPVSKKLIEDGERHMLLKRGLDLPFPVRILHGLGDHEVSPSVARRLAQSLRGPDITLTLTPGADHRYSSPACLALITDAITDVTERSLARKTA